jgi:hypothetical protein
LFVSCEEQGTLRESQATKNEPCIIGKDTIDLYLYWPSNLTNIWIAKVRNSNPPVVSLTYQEGKTQNTVIIVNKDNDVKNNRFIKGDIISENDSVIVIKKKK